MSDLPKNIVCSCGCEHVHISNIKLIIANDDYSYSSYYEYGLRVIEGKSFIDCECIKEMEKVVLDKPIKTKFRLKEFPFIYTTDCEGCGVTKEVSMFDHKGTLYTESKTVGNCYSGE